MPNKWPKCQICRLRHRPEKCKGKVDLKEIPALIAMLVYALLGWAVVRSLWVVFDRVSARSVTTYDRSRQ